MYLTYIYPDTSVAYLWKNESEMFAFHTYCVAYSLIDYLPPGLHPAVSLELTDRRHSLLAEICTLNVESYHGICDLVGFNSVTRVNIMGSKRMPIINIRQPIAKITSYHIPPNVKQENVIRNRIVIEDGWPKHEIVMRTVNLAVENKKSILKNSMRRVAVC